MKTKIFSVLLAICFIIGVLCLAPTVSAAEIKKGIVEVSTVNGITGEEVVVPVLIKENPGIMAVTISVTYEPDALEYVGYYYGNVFNDYTIAAHPDRKLVRVVICETRNKKTDGKIISLRFNVKKDAKAELTPINVEYSRGDFCNWNLDKIMPEVVSGGVEVAFNGENCPHKKYGEWSVVTEPVCEEVGVKVRTCDFCGHNDYKEIKPIGHTYSENWTVDKPATEDRDGTMSRYCIRCDDYVDRITFSLEQSEKEEIDNTIWEDFTDNEKAEEIFKEQNPGKSPTKNPANQNSSASKNNSSSSQSSGKKPQNGSAAEGEDNSNSDIKDEETLASKENALEQLLPEIETDDGEKISVFDKLTEAFPKLEKVITAARVMLIILVVIVLL